MIKLSKDNYFMLFSCCIPVKGALRSTICDLQRNSFIYIPNEIAHLMSLEKATPIEEIESLTAEEVHQYVEYLEEEQYGFTTDSPSSFPKINVLNNDYPTKVKDMIIDFDQHSQHDLKKISADISELMCSAMEMRYFDSPGIEKFREDVLCFQNSTIRTINVTIKYSDDLAYEKLAELCTERKRLKQIVVHSAPEDAIHQLDIQTIIIYSTEVVTDASHCGNISPQYFQANVDFFRESVTANNCLDKKIGIDKKGNIKNCPSMSQSFGHISETDINDVIALAEFQKLWAVRKDQISTCKDCEFRYICMDCRAFTAEDNNEYSKPKKCSYDPYQAVWAD